MHIYHKQLISIWGTLQISFVFYLWQKLQNLFNEFTKAVIINLLPQGLKAVFSSLISILIF